MKKIETTMIELEPREVEAFDVVLQTLDKITYLFNETDEVILKMNDTGHTRTIIDGEPHRAIQAIEEMFGVYD